MEDKNTNTPSDIVVIIRPSLKRACCEGDACRSAVFNQLLYCIAWKHKYHKDYWFGSYEEICTKLLDDSWGLSKVIKEVKALISQGFIEQRRNPTKGWDQTRQYLFGKEQAKKFREACKKANITCIEHQMGFPPDVIHLLKITNAIDENNKCNCQIQQMHLVNPTNPSVKNNDAIPKTTTKVSTEREGEKDIVAPSSQQTPNVSTGQESSHSFIPSQNQSLVSSQQTTNPEAKPNVVFPEEAEQVYQLLVKLNITCLKRNEEHRDGCMHLASKGVTISEKLESLMQHCWQKSYLKDKDLNLKNLINELPGWLQLQRRTSAAPSTGVVVSTMAKATADLLAKEEETKQRILAQEAAKGQRPMRPSERILARSAKVSPEATEKPDNGSEQPTPDQEQPTQPARPKYGPKLDEAPTYQRLPQQRVVRPRSLFARQQAAKEAQEGARK